MKIRTIILFLISLFSFACQHNNNNYSEKGKFYFHRVKKVSSKKKIPEVKVYIDGKQVDDLDNLDRVGIEQKAGAHAIEFEGKNLNLGLKEIDYNLKKNEELHLFYCESDGSIHSYTFPAINDFNESLRGTPPFNEYTQASKRLRRKRSSICSK